MAGLSEIEEILKKINYLLQITEACEKATVEYAEAEAARAANGGGGAGEVRD